MSKLHFALFSMLVSTGAAMAESTVLLDYRDQGFREKFPEYGEDVRAEIKSLLGSAPQAIMKDLGEDFTILGDAQGSFTAAGADETIYLVQKHTAPALDPFPEGAAPVLVASAQGELAGVFSLPSDRLWDRLVLAEDINGDDISEVFLDSGFFNMGQSTTMLEVFAVNAPDGATLIQEFPEVHLSSCGSEDARAEKVQRAATISLGPEGLEVTEHDIGC